MDQDETHNGEEYFQSTSCDNMETFVNDVFTELQGLAGETHRFNLLTEELGTIASIFDSRRQLQSWLTSYHQAPQSDSNFNQNDANSNGIGVQKDENSASFSIDVGQKDINSLGVVQQNNGLIGQMNASLTELKNQKKIVSASNGHMMELNLVLHDSILELIHLNRNLTDQNYARQSNVDDLSSEIERLQNERNLLRREIEVLNGNVSGLFDSLNEHESLNNDLEASILELNRQNQILYDSNGRYSQLNAQLNESVSDLQAQNEFLAEQNEVFAGLNTDLNVTAGILTDEVSRLEESAHDLEVQNNRLNTLVVSLNDKIDSLSYLNERLDETTTELNSEVDRLSDENTRLEVLTTELSSIVSFLNETTVDADESFDAVTSFLSEQITAYRSVVLETLHNTYIQRVANWDCSFRDVFSDQGFIRNGAVPIPESVYMEVIDYIDDRILSNLCLGIVDFTNYLEFRYNERPATMNHLISGVEGYTTAALNHYFPDDEEADGLTAENWAAAGYECDNLIQNQRFSFEISNI